MSEDKLPQWEDVQDNLVAVKTLAGHDIVGVDEGGETQGVVRIKFAHEVVMAQQPGQQRPQLVWSEPFHMIEKTDDLLELSLSHVIFKGKPVAQVVEMFLVGVLGKEPEPQIAVPDSLPVGGKLILP
jgi:hypothetical protein